MPMKILYLIMVTILVSFQPVAAGEELTCNMANLTEAELASYQKLAGTLLGSVEETRELRNGYAFRLPAQTLVDVSQWISYERKCCPFFAFELEITKNEGPVWLRITGARGVKEFIRAEFGL